MPTLLMYIVHHVYNNKWRSDCLLSDYFTLATRMAEPIARFEAYNETDDIEEYFERVELFFEVHKVATAKKVAHLLSDIGPKTYTVLKSLTAPTLPAQCEYARIKEVLIQHYKPTPLTIAERFAFHKREQLPEEKINDFVIELRKLAQSCDFGDFLEQALRDRFVCGLTNTNMQKRLLTEKNLTLERAISLATAMEMAVLEPQGSKKPNYKEEEEVNRVGTQRYMGYCFCCGKKGHLVSQCRFRTYRCHKCSKVGHLQAVCPGDKTTQEANKKVEKQQESKKSRSIQQLQSSDTLYENHIWVVTGGHKEGYRVQVLINGKPVKMELDTGATVSVMSEKEWNELFQGTDELKPYTGNPLRGYSGQQLNVVGQSTVQVLYEQQLAELPLVVVAGTKGPALLGRNWLAVIKLNWSELHRIQSDKLREILEKHAALFEKKIGTIQGYKADIRLKPEAKPIFKKSRPIAYALQAALTQEIEYLQQEGILEPVEASEWATPLVVVPKANGRLRVCGDYKVTINQCVEKKVYPLPTTEDLFAQIAGGQFFSKLDMSQAYQQLALDEDSKRLLVVNTPRGLFRYTRLPYGVSTAPAIFQSVMDRILQGLPVACYLDDILIATKTKEEHDQLLEQTLGRLEHTGIKLRQEKCEFYAQQLCYLGHRIDAKGIHPTEDKVQAIKDAPIPENVSQLRAFLGLMNYYSKFIPQAAARLAPLYKLLEKNTAWQWTEQCTSAFQESKLLLTSDAVLAHYDTKKQLKLACDASQYGLGAVLSHVSEGEERPIAFASRTLSKAERNYGQVEKEALALIFGVKKFHKYVYGRPFTMVTDHKPLLSILNAKAAVPSVAAARMQRWAMFLAAYQYNIEYKCGKAHANADGLSRLPIEGSEELEDPVAMFQVSFVEELPVTATDIARETSRDTILAKVYQYVMEGWPQKVQEGELKPFYQRKDQLSTDQGCLLWGLRVIIPTNVQARLLNELHTTHPGVVKMKAIARSIMWWPNMDKEIEDVVSSCQSCAAHRSSPPLAPLHVWPWANHPMQRIHIDFAAIEQFQVLVIIDSHSKWIEAVPLRSATSSTTIDALRVFFASFGVPEEIVSDNGPQFTSQEFNHFCVNNGIKHTLIPPYHPATNGAAERAVQVIKQAVKKMDSELSLKRRLARFLLVYRTTPQATTEMRPDELFLHRRLRTRLTLLQPSLLATVEKHQHKQKEAHDNGKPLVLFTKGDTVLVRNQKGTPKWTAGRVLRQKGPVSYLVRVGSRVRYCHADHLLKTKVMPEEEARLVPNETKEPQAWEYSFPIDSEVEENPDTADTSIVPRHSTRSRQPPRRLIEEMDK